jgi:hypothetical protein
MTCRDHDDTACNHDDHVLGITSSVHYMKVIFITAPLHHDPACNGDHASDDYMKLHGPRPIGRGPGSLNARAITFFPKLGPRAGGWRRPGRRSESVSLKQTDEKIKYLDMYSWPLIEAPS